MLTYQVRVKTHLSSDWRSMSNLISIENSFDTAGGPVTDLLLQVIDRCQLMSILCEFHELNLELLSLELLSNEKVCCGSLIP